MQKIRSSISKKLPPLELYEDEIRELYDFLSALCKEPVVTQTCGYRLDSLDEIANLPKKKTNSLSFSCRQPYIEIRLTEVNGDIYIGSGDIEAEGIASRIESILFQGKVSIPFLPDTMWLSFLIYVPLAAGFFLADRILIIAGVLLIFLFIVWSVWEYRFKTQRYNTIIFSLRKNTPGFWHRNKDQIIMLLIGSVIGALVTLLVSITTK